MSGSSTRDSIARLHRTMTPDNPPEAGFLKEGELSVEMSDPMRIWMGVPIGLDPTGRRLLYDRTWIPPGGPFVPISGGLMTGPLTLYGDPTQPLHAVPLRYLQANYAPIAGGGYVQKIGDTMSGSLTIASPTDANLYVTGTGTSWPGVKWNTTQAGSATGYFEAQRAGKSRWSVVFGTNEAETGGNAGTNFRINRFADDGTVLVPMPFSITRASGMVNIGTRLTLAVDPTAPLEAVTMQWVQNNYPTPAQGDARWVNVDGDTMTGPLLVPTGTAALPSLGSSVTAGTGIFFPGSTIHFTTAGTDVLIVSGTNLRSLNPYRAPDGITGLPAYTFASDPSSGLFRASAGNIALSVSGTTRTTWTASAMTSTVPVVLPGDPVNPLEAVPLQFLQGNYLTTTQGDLRWVNVSGDTMTGALTINMGSVTPPVSPDARGSLFLFPAGGGSNSSHLVAYSFGPVSPGISGVAAGGTAEAPTATGVGYSLINMQGFGRGTTAYSGARANFNFRASETWTDTAQGTYFQLETTATGTTTMVAKARLTGAGNLILDPTGTFTDSGARLQVNGGLNLGNGLAASSADLTRHINLYDGGPANSFGFNVSFDGTNAHLNYVVTEATHTFHTFVVGAANIATIGTPGLTMLGPTDIVLARDPSQPMHATNKQWIEANYSTNNQGDTRWVNVTGDTMTGPLIVNGANPQITLNAAAGVFRSLAFNTNNQWRWHFTVTGDPESGANAGSNFTISRMDDTGAPINAPFTISRATGRANFVNGISTNNNVALSGSDLSQHIDLYGGTYGFSITGFTLNLVSAQVIALLTETVERARFTAIGLTMGAATDITLDRDPTQPMHATNKRWADAQLALYLPLTGGTLTGAVTFNAGVYANAGLAVQGGDLYVGWAGAGGAFARLNTAPGYYKAYNFMSNSLSRWDVGVGGTAEPVDGSNAGADLIVQRFNDAGGLMGTVLTFSRVSGLGTVYGDPVDPLGIATKKYADDTIVRFGGPFLPLTAGSGVPLSGELYLPLTLPTLDQHATNKVYVDQRDAILAQEIAALAQNLIFVGQIDVTTDTATFTTASGVPSPGPLPAPQEAYKGFYLIVIVPGDALQPSNIPPGTYVRSDWLVCDGTTWVWLKLGLVYFTASEVEVLPPIEGTTHVQETLQWLADNKVDLDGDTLTGPLYLHADPTTDPMAANKHYVDGVITRAGGPFLPIAGGTLTGPLISTKLTDQSGDIASGTVTNSTGAFLSLVAAPSVGRGLKWFSGGHVIWQFSTTDAEFGGAADSGGNLAMFRYSDNGTFLGKPWQVHRDTGSVEFANGITFGNQTGGTNWDLTKHISLWGTSYGLSVTAARLNYVTDAGGNHVFVVGNNDAFQVNGGGSWLYVPLTMSGPTDITLARDPSAAMHAVNKGWIETNYSTNSQGDARWVNTTGDTMTGPLQINYNPTDTSAQLWLRPAGGGDLVKSIIRFNGTFAAAVGDGGPRYVASIRAGFVSNAWSYENLDIWLNNGGSNDANSDLNQTRVARFQLAQITFDRPTTFLGGQYFSDGTVGTPWDLSRHIRFHSANYGFSVTNTGMLAHVTDAPGSNVFIAGTTETARINTAGLTMAVGDITLFRDPTADMHAVNRRWIQSNYSSNTEGDTRWVNVGGDTMNGGLQINAYAPAWGSFNFGAQLVLRGVQNNGIGIFDSSDANPIAIINGAGRLSFNAMPAWGDSTTPPVEWLGLASAEATFSTRARFTQDVTANANLTVDGHTQSNTSMDVRRFSFQENLGTVPPGIGGGYLAWNVSQGQGEVDFINGYAANGGFKWLQMTGPGAWAFLMDLSPAGHVTLWKGNGVAYPGISGGGNAFGFTWNGGFRVYVDGTDQGLVAFKSDLPVASATPPLMDGGANAGTASAWSRGDHVHPTQIRTGLVDANTSRTVGAGELATLGLYMWGSPTGPVTLTLPVTTTATTMWQAMNITGQPITLAGADGGTITVQPGGNQMVWTDGGGVYPMNTTSVTPGAGSNDNSVATTGWSQGTFVNASGDTMTGGLSFGGTTVGAANDTTRHITLYGGFGGLSVTGGRINVVGGSIFMVNTDNTDIAHFDGGGLWMNGLTDITLARAPTAAMHATTKAYVDQFFAPITGGNYVSKSGDVMTGPLGMGVAVTASAKPHTIQTEMLIIPNNNGGVGSNVFVDNVGGGNWRALATGAGWAMINGSTDTWQLQTWTTSTAGATVAAVGRLTFDGRGSMGLNFYTPQTQALPNANGGWLFGWGATLNNWAGNAFYDGTNWRYLAAGNAWNVQGANGASFMWQAAASGAAGAIAPMATQMQLSFDGGLNVNLSIRTRQIFVINPPGGDSTINLDGINGTYRYISGLTNGLSRWQIQMPDAGAESGANGGSNFIITRFDDAGNYLGAPLSISRATGNVTIAQTLSVNSGRAISAGVSNPAVTVYNTPANSAGGMWQGADGSLYFGDCDGGGTPQTGRMYLDRSSQLWGTAAITSGYLHSTGGANVDAALGVSGRATLNEIMCLSGVFRVANNDAYYMSRGSDGMWNFVENNSAIAWINNAGISCRSGQSGLLTGGDGVILQMSPNWYWNWNSSNGDLAWMEAGVAKFLLQAGVCMAYYGPTFILAGNNIGIRYASGAWTSGNTFCFGWSNAVSGLATIGVDNGGAAYALANASDARLKHNVGPSKFDCLDAISNLSLVEFDWLQVDNPWQLKQARAMPRISAVSRHKVRAGLIAQEVARVIPEAVHAGDDFEDHLGRVWNLDSNVMDAVLVGAIQQLVAQNTALAARVTQLEQQRIH